MSGGVTQLSVSSRTTLLKKNSVYTFVCQNIYECVILVEVGDWGRVLMYVVEVVVKGHDTLTKKKRPEINGNSFGADGVDLIIVVCRGRQ